MKRTLFIEPLPQLNHLTPQQVFAQFAHQPFHMLFDSAQHPNAGFDLILFAPEAVLTAHEQQLHFQPLKAQDSTFTLQTSLFESLTSLQTHYFAETDIEIPCKILPIYQKLPFVVGIAGSFGYELNTFLETLPTPKNRYQTPDMIAGVFTQSIIYDRTEKCYYHCYLSRVPLEAPKVEDVTREQSEFTLTSDWHADKTQAQYIESINAIHEYILSGDCYQVNFAMRFAARYSGDEYAAYCLLSQHNQAPFSSFIRTEQGAILSISPERFVQIKDNQVNTKPIKGTMPRFVDPIDDQASAKTLLDSEKDRAENLMIVDLLRNDLSKHCEPHSVKVPKLFALESYPAVHHLVSTIEGQLQDNVHPWQLFSGAFPGGSITGAPKVRAMEVIHELEATARHIYCGSIGYVGIKNDMDSNIAIRTLLCEHGQIYCWAGGGIVLDSNAQDEYAELHAKVSKILPLLKEQSLGATR
ncbi:MAG: aminodeoxychorismate synthase component I [Alteromonadaceae bacterium]|nr:aminodeoxychorismate synthase component I [Alteromonadaceae bacterium]